MSDQLALVPHIEDRQIALTTEGELLIGRALERSALIAVVGNEVENKVAVDAQVEIKGVINLLEKTRTEYTKPLLDAQRKLKAFFDGKADELKKEMMRVGKLSCDYASLELAKARAAENARREDLTRLEREREAALAKVGTHAEREAVQEHFNERAAIEAPPVQVPTAKGQSVALDIEIIVVDVWALARAHPTCVNIEPRMSDIKSLIKAGIKVAGVTSREVTRQTIRAIPGKAIDI